MSIIVLTNMESLNTLVSLITCRPLSHDESTKMTAAIVEVRKLLDFAEKVRLERKAQMSMPPWNR